MTAISPAVFLSSRIGPHPLCGRVVRHVALLCALAFWPGSPLAQGNPARLLTTYANPTPANFDLFGAAVAGFGTDRLLVGTDGAGGYLFSTSGALLTTFTISDPAAFGFGNPIAAAGRDGVLIGAYSYGTTAQNGRAYLFRTNGALQTTFTNPAPATVQAFGLSAAAFGGDRVLIGGLPDLNNAAPYPGGVFLFRTNGALLATFTNPHPATGDSFGLSVAAVGNDRVLIGAPQNNIGAAQAGAAYLFNTNGALVFTFTNPVPVASDNFGTSVAAVGNDRVLIGAIDYGGSGNGGVAYLFNTNGTLQTTFTNPTPAANDYFAWSVAAVGSSRVLIGAYWDGSDVFRSGSAYLFSTNGSLLTTFTNPTPAVADDFGWSVAAVGSSQVLIGALFDNTGAPDSGAAYLFDLPYPPIGITHSAATVSLKWYTPETGLALQQAGVLGTPTTWSNSTDAVSVTGLTNFVQLPLGNTNVFYRLHRP